MADTPDFEQIARDIIKSIWGNDVLESRDQVSLTLVQQLREVWNARGAADIQAVKDDLGLLGSAGVSPGYVRAIKEQDR